MPNLSAVLKNEIARLSKREARKLVSPTQAAVYSHRKQLAALKRQVQMLEREVAALRRRSPAVAAPTAEEEGGGKHRFTAKGLKSLRGRLGLSAEEFGRLIDVSAQTVYGWESERTSPRRRQIPVIAGLRKIGKKEAQRRLSEMSAA